MYQIKKKNSLKIKMLCSHPNNTHTFYMQFQCERAHFVYLLSNRLRILFCWSLSHHLIYGECTHISHALTKQLVYTCVLYCCCFTFVLGLFLLSQSSSHTHTLILLCCVNGHIVMHIRYTDIYTCNTHSSML